MVQYVSQLRGLFAVRHMHYKLHGVVLLLAPLHRLGLDWDNEFPFFHELAKNFLADLGVIGDNPSLPVNLLP